RAAPRLPAARDVSVAPAHRTLCTAAARQAAGPGADCPSPLQRPAAKRQDEHSPGEALMGTGRRRTRGSGTFEPVAGNGLLDRRLLLRGGLAFASASTGAAIT